MGIFIKENNILEATQRFIEMLVYLPQKNNV